MQAGDAAGAARYLDTVRQAGGVPGLSEQGWLALGDAHQRAGDWDEALDAWSNASRPDRPSFASLERLEKAHLQLGDWNTAAQDLRHIRVLEVWIAGQQVHTNAPASQGAGENGEMVGR